MEPRNLDFEIELTEDQWDDILRRAEVLGAEEGGFARPDHNPGEIRVFLRPEDAPPLWRNYVGADDTYGVRNREVAQFRFNGGRPYAHIDSSYVVAPVFTEEEESAMQAELESWVRGRWHDLLREAGLHYDRGHLPQG